MAHWEPQRSEVLHSATVSTQRPLARSHFLPSEQSASLVHSTQVGEAPGEGEAHLRPPGQQLQEVPAQLSLVEQGWQVLSPQVCPRGQWSSVTHSWHSLSAPQNSPLGQCASVLQPRHSLVAGSQRPLGHCESSEHWTQVKVPLRLRHSGVEAPQGEQLGPQKTEESQGAHSAAPLQ